MKKRSQTQKNKRGKTSIPKRTPGKKNSAKKIVKKKKPGNELFPVVAIGASAGGIEAISNLLENISPKLGMAYVIIQHLAPDHESILPELLERKTRMPVHQVENDMHLLPDNVYVIPPNTYMGVADSKLKLLPRVKSDGGFHSIDFFLNALASVYKQKAIAIILSGSASDGTIGIQSIKMEGGITIAQDESAKFRSMPESAIDSGFIDFILPPPAIAKHLETLPKIVYSLASIDKTPQQNINESQLRKIYFLLHDKRNVDFSHYKSSTINRRIIRRMMLNKVSRVEQYIKLLQQNPAEVELLYKDLLINVTSFFRDGDTFSLLTKKIFPALVKGRKPNDPIRIWIPACSSGEEAYSIAMCLFEFLKEKAVTTSIKIFATDLNEASIEKARQGIYTKSSMENVSARHLKKFFSKTNSGYEIIKSIREVCVFAVHDLLKDPPFSKMDLISCQNVMIYLEANSQKKILESFHYALKPSGCLLLGKSEAIGSTSELFTQKGGDHKVYVKKNTELNSSFDFSMPAYYPPEISKAPKKLSTQQILDDNIDKETEKLLLSRYVPASIVVDKHMQIKRFLGAASHYLQPASGKANLLLLKMVRDELIFDLQNLLLRAKKESKSVKKEGIIVSENGHSKELNLEVVPIKPSSREPYFLILFKEVISSPDAQASRQQKTGEGRTNTDPKNQHIIKLEKQLRESKEQIRTMSEEFEAAREELQSANEEVLSSNEELQSINEELETSKEELQSTNEELTTINEELQTRYGELQEANEYAHAIIETLHEPLIILNVDLRIKTANKAFYKSFLVTPEETVGNYIYDLGNKQWNIPDLREQLKLVQTKNKGVNNFKVTHNFPVIGQKVMLLNAQKLVVKGGKEALILLAMEDITDRSLAEEKLKGNEERLRLLVQNAFDILTILSKDGTILYESESIERILGYSAIERVGKNVFSDPIVHDNDREIKRAAFQKAISAPHEVVKTEFRLRHKNGSFRDIEAVYVNLLDDPRVGGVVANYHDITDRKILEQQKDEFIGIASHELKTPVTSIKAYTQILQDVFEQAQDKNSAGMLEKMNSQVDRLTGLIVDLLDFTRIEGGRLKFREEDFELNELITEIAEEMQISARNHTIEMKLGRPAQMHGDRERIGQVLTNLLSNAIKYSPNGKRIIITSKVEEGKVTISVQDFGIGIDG
ncbi:MAG TPA: CheR family methyltransferase, partial [Chitinophagaceae bacterium]|nr:CheR family methyltransferase [Chitinophagaceae bacterium]